MTEIILKQYSISIGPHLKSLVILKHIYSEVCCNRMHFQTNMIRLAIQRLCRC